MKLVNWATRIQMDMNKMKKNTLQLFSLILTLLIWWNAGFGAEKQSDYWPTKGWRIASPESQGMDSNLLARMLDTIWENDIEIHGIMIVRNGYVVLDAYSYPLTADDIHPIYSITKSVTSALVGIAIDKGYIKNEKLPVLSFFSKRVVKNLDNNKKAITIQHLLTMSSGLECRDSYHDYWIGLRQLESSPDWVQFIIDLPMAEAPGTHFNYCNGGTFLLSAILQKQTGINSLLFAEKYFFGPLGILGVDWPSNPQGISIGYGGLHMRPQDMAKIGYLYLNNGLWEDKQIISSKWIKGSTRKHISTTESFDYGYQWWITDSSEYLAMGYGGQYIFVVPENNIVAVFTSNLDRKDWNIPTGFLKSNIISSVKSDKPLPENSQAEKALKSKITRWQNTDPSDREKSEKKS